LYFRFLEIYPTLPFHKRPIECTQQPGKTERKKGMNEIEIKQTQHE